MDKPRIFKKLEATWGTVLVMIGTIGNSVITNLIQVAEAKDSLSAARAAFD